MTKQRKPQPVALAEPHQALMGYLQTLLDEVPEPLEEGTRQASGTNVETRVSEPEVVERAVVVESAVDVEAPVVVQRPVETEMPDRSVPEPAVQPGPVIPDWGRRPFQVIGFEVGGIALCLPLEQLGGIVRWDGGLSRLPGMPPWQLGILQVRGNRVVVVDFARLLMPDREGAKEGYVLLLAGERWGLACERLAETLNVAPEAVRWRRTPGRPPYLLGVLGESLTPIVGVEEVLDRLVGEASTRRTGEM